MASYDPAAIEAAQIYWRVASTPEARTAQITELWELTERLRNFLARTASIGGATLIEIS